MSTRNSCAVLLDSHPPPALVRAIGDAGLTLRTVDDPGDPTDLKELAASGSLAVTVIGPGLRRPIVAARQAFRIAPQVQILFVTGDCADLRRRALLPAARIGDHWIIAGETDTDLGLRLAEAARATHRRLDLDATLNRMNRMVLPLRPAEDYHGLLLRAEQDREALIAELSAKNVELEKFSYTVAHDLKSPMVTIKGFLGFLAQDLAAGKTERALRDMAKIESALNKMAIMTEGLLELSRIGRVIQEPVVVPFGEIVDDALELVRGRIAGRGVRVEVEDDLPAVPVDRIRMVGVVQNLVDNAVKFIGERPDPKIEIGCRLEDDEACFFVRDNGRGIAPDQQARVFDLFERLDREVEGTGIGLALVRRILDLHHGRIWIRSDGEGCGTTVWFTLPLA